MIHIQIASDSVLKRYEHPQQYSYLGCILRIQNTSRYRKTVTKKKTVRPQMSIVWLRVISVVFEIRKRYLSLPNFCGAVTSSLNVNRSWTDCGAGTKRVLWKSDIHFFHHLVDSCGIVPVSHINPMSALEYIMGCHIRKSFSTFQDALKSNSQRSAAFDMRKWGKCFHSLSGFIWNCRT